MIPLPSSSVLVTIFAWCHGSGGEGRGGEGRGGEGSLSCVFPVTGHLVGHGAPMLIRRISQPPLTVPRAPKEWYATYHCCLKYSFT